MRTDIVKLLTSAAIGIALFAIYFLFLNSFLNVVNLSNLSETESIILCTQIIRVIIIFVVGLKYQIQPIIPIIVFSFEALLIPPLLVLIVFTNAPFYAIFMGVILTAWFGATAVVLEPYAIYVFARNLIRDASIIGVLAIASFELISVLFLSSLLSSVTQPVQGLTGLGTLIITQIRGEVGSGGVPNPAQDLVTTTALLLFFVGLLFYMAMGNYSLGSKLKVPGIIVVSLVGTILAFLWIAFAAVREPDIFVSLSAPAIILTLIIWGSARGK